MKMIKNIFYGIFLLIVLISYLLLLELSRNSLWGWTVGICIIIGYAIARYHFINKGCWNIKTGLGALFMTAVLLVINVKISEPPYKQVPATDAKNPKVTDVVSVEQGDLTGVYNEDETARIYAAIPYAKPPIGELRWKEPAEPEKWQGIRACDTYAPMAVQPSSSILYSSLSKILGTHNYEFSFNDQYKEPMSEDCLYLNIYAPAQDPQEPLPVIFFVHGGSLTTGQSYYTEYRGENLASKGVIFVNFAYRLGVLGYMANEELSEESANGTTGNYGLLDQIMALEWVHDNISAFGGDPDNITIAGESAGSSSVNALCVSPLTEGLFVRAIAESSSISSKKPYHTFRDYEDAIEVGNKILNEFGVKDVNGLRNIPAEELVKTNYPNSSMCIDGYAITEQPYETYLKGENHEQALLNGSNLKEADAFLLDTKATKDNYIELLNPILGEFSDEAAELIPAGSIERDQTFIVDAGGDAKGSLSFIYSDAWFSYSHYIWSHYMEQEGRPVYQYFFTKTNNYLSNHHAGEMPYAYGNLYLHQGLYDENDYKLSEAMQNYWVNFAKTGDPNGEGLTKWPLWNSSEDKLLEFNDEIKLIDNPYHELNKILDKYQYQ